MKSFLVVIFLLSIFLESSVTTIPLFFLVLLSFFVLERKEWIFFLAFLGGIFLDMLSFRSIGITSAFFVLFLFLVFLYERKFETATVYFIFASSLLGSILFLGLFYNTGSLILESIISSLLGVLIFVILSKFVKTTVKRDVLGSRL